ncbi:hypothetical protein ACIP69_18080 [Streptomyces hygroscopicus]|uniref:hypothetical protein n=1 Tax=Streptomyces hygroscopicus TaxID=1912 RepID=UPI0037F6BEE0
MADTTTVCADCREMQENRAWVLRVLGHDGCIKALRAEQLAARKFWIRIHPNGCVVGSVLEASVGPLAEDAHKEFTPRVKDRRREAAEGYRHELVGHDEWKRRAEPCLLGDCDHRRAAS